MFNDHNCLQRVALKLWRFGNIIREFWAFFIAHAQKGHLGASYQKPDLAICFGDPDFQ